MVIRLHRNKEDMAHLHKATRRNSKAVMGLLRDIHRNRKEDMVLLRVLRLANSLNSRDTGLLP